jgi:subfamily B ATP-binding cassette protein MsbA
VSKGADLLSGRQLYRRLFVYVRRYAWVFGMAVFGMLVNAATQPIFAEVMRRITDEGFVDRNLEFIRQIPWILIALFMVRALSEFIDTYCIRWVGRNVIFDVRADMFERLLHLPGRFYDNHSSASLGSKFVYDIEQVATAATRAVTVMIKDTATILALLGYMAWLSWQLTVTFVFLAPLLALLVRLASRRMRLVSRNIQQSIGGLAETVKEAVQGHRVVKTFGGHDYERENFRRANERNRHQAMKKALLASVNPAVIEVLAAAAIGWIIYLATQPALAVTTGTFVSFVVALMLLLAAGRRLSKIMEPIQMGLAAADSAFALIDEGAEPDAGTRRLGRVRGEVTYRNVGFHYGSKRSRVLYDISFNIEPGRTVALVGPSGSGKSSIAALLARFYEAEQGEILIDGVNINEVVLSDLRRNLSMVTQETVLFNDTIEKNIAYGWPGEPDRERLIDAARAAHVLEFAERMPDGLETLIGEHGIRLSGGQRQRIAIARALFKDAPILILDEATSSLDAESEREVQDAINNLITNRTTLVIAHRLSTIEHADRILVLHRGRIVEEGTHAELLAGGGHYARLYRTQFVSSSAPVRAAGRDTGS